MKMPRNFFGSILFVLASGSGVLIWRILTVNAAKIREASVFGAQHLNTLTTASS